MTPIAPTIPFHLARTYAAGQADKPLPTPPAQPSHQPGSAERAQPGQRPEAPLRIRPSEPRRVEALETRPGTKMSPGTARLVAARVPGAIDFTETGDPEPARGRGPAAPLSLYRHPADRNAAATGVDLGRAIDLDA